MAKLTYDRRAFVEPGLRVAREVDRLGVRTGPPVPTANEELCLDVDGPAGESWTLALLRYEPGAPLDGRHPDAPSICADLLARTDRALLTLTDPSIAPARTLDWFAAFVAERGGDAAAATLRAIERGRPLTEGVVYGDPSPEILLGADGAVAALVDWGTPSWGPLLLDVAIWATFVSAGQDGRRDEFLRGYRRHRLLAEPEYRLLPQFTELVSVLTDARGG